MDALTQRQVSVESSVVGTPIVVRVTIAAATTTAAAAAPSAADSSTYSSGHENYLLYYSSGILNFLSIIQIINKGKHLQFAYRFKFAEPYIYFVGVEKINNQNISECFYSNHNRTRLRIVLV